MSAPEWFLPFVPLPAWARDTPPADFQGKVERYVAFRQANDKDFKWDRLAPDTADQDAIKEAAAAQNRLPPVPVGPLSREDWTAIDKAIADGHLDARPVDAGNYPDFSGHAVVDVQLPPDLWNATDSQQFRWLNEQLFADGGVQAKSFPWTQGSVERDTPPHGYTWHHHQQPGRMQLVPFGVHGAVQHSGGRQVWAKGDR